jgi:hypothetical protein
MTSVLSPSNHTFSTKSRRSNRPQPLSTLPSPSSNNRSNYFANPTNSSPSSSPADAPSKSSQNSSVVIDASDVPISSVGLLMPSAFDFPQAHNADFYHDLWSNIGSPQVVANSTPRDQSSRSMSRPLYGAQTHASGKNHNRGAASLPTPTQTPTKNTFLQQQSPSTISQQPQDLDLPIASSMALGQALSQSHNNMNENISQLPHSGRQQYSSMAQEPITPMTAVTDFHESRRIGQSGETYHPDIDAWLAEYSRSGNNTENITNSMVPKFERTVTDAYQDELYLPQQMQSSQPSATSYLMPHNNSMVQERLHDARMARTASSSTNQSGPMSPFKATSPFMHSPGPYSQQVAPVRREGTEPKTISPQEAMLDYKPQREEMPLFAQTGADYGTYSTIAPNSSKASYQNVPSMAFNGMQQVNHGAWSADLQQATLSSAPLQNFNFTAPSLPSNLSGLPNPYLASAPTTSTNAINRQPDQTPVYPPRLISMESSASEAAPASSAASSTLLNSPKPPSNADTGTYSCTYHGCTQRFATSRDLQKHKRDSHRNNPNVTPGVGSGMSTAQLMERNSQTGPHRCERINPTTGKPCNTNFSRPYDLTRHEDTIHNIRKLKLKCALCQEEKLFSRNDALTRHLRVVHPEVDFPGKHRRRGTRGE